MKFILILVIIGLSLNAYLSKPNTKKKQSQEKKQIKQETKRANIASKQDDSFPLSLADGRHLHIDTAGCIESSANICGRAYLSENDSQKFFITNDNCLNTQIGNYWFYATIVQTENLKAVTSDSQKGKLAFIKTDNNSCGPNYAFASQITQNGRKKVKISAPNNLGLYITQSSSGAYCLGTSTVESSALIFSFGDKVCDLVNADGTCLTKITDITQLEGENTLTLQISDVYDDTETPSRKLAKRTNSKQIQIGLYITDEGELAYGNIGEGSIKEIRLQLNNGDVTFLDTSNVNKELNSCCNPNQSRLVSCNSDDTYRFEFTCTGSSTGETMVLYPYKGLPLLQVASNTADHVQKACFAIYLKS